MPRWTMMYGCSELRTFYNHLTLTCSTIFFFFFSLCVCLGKIIICARPLFPSNWLVLTVPKNIQVKSCVWRRMEWEEYAIPEEAKREKENQKVQCAPASAASARFTAPVQMDVMWCVCTGFSLVWRKQRKRSLSLNIIYMTRRVLCNQSVFNISLNFPRRIEI